MGVGSCSRLRGCVSDISGKLESGQTCLWDNKWREEDLDDARRGGACRSVTVDGRMPELVCERGDKVSSLE